MFPFALGGLEPSRGAACVLACCCCCQSQSLKDIPLTISQMQQYLVSCQTHNSLPSRALPCLPPSALILGFALDQSAVQVAHHAPPNPFPLTDYSFPLTFAALGAIDSALELRAAAFESSM